MAPLCNRHAGSVTSTTTLIARVPRSRPPVRPPARPPTRPSAHLPARPPAMYAQVLETYFWHRIVSLSPEILSD